eukprot:TRINITY_DN64102_c0_g1_i1.p1 TRINITY_DN64102_c0_g1~~TRINITY_DN64102_c0_g1_i1.p1  ORF type:complete len:258 (-),score=39.35 TRINITY_DN64102_c0_g1_i1:99-872(-)
MSDPAVLLAVQNCIATITLNSPKTRNSLSAPLINALGDHLKECMANDAVRVVVLTNVGDTFCAGANLKNAGGEAPRYTLVDIFKIMHEGSKVILGKIAGHCTGGGVGLAAACDISVIRADVEMGFTEVRIGVSPAIISVVCLPKLRRGDAAELMLSGEKISASRAAEVGLVNYAVPPDQIDSKVGEIASKLIKGGPQAMAATKSLIYRVPGMALDDAFNWTAEVSAKCFMSQEAREGIRAFTKREAAPWVRSFESKL